MKLTKEYLYTLFFAGGLFCFCYIIISFDATETKWNHYPDVNDYKVQSEASLFSSDFYAPRPKPGIWFFPRPFTVPLFLKIAGSDPVKLITLQKYMYCACVICLLLAFLQYITYPFIKIIAQFGLLFFFTWWNIVGWHHIPLSESLSISLMFLWFGSILFHYKKQNILTFIFFIVVSFLLSFTRDTWPYIILSFCALNIFISKWLIPGSFKKSIGLFLFSVCLFFKIIHRMWERGTSYLCLIHLLEEYLKMMCI